MYILVYMKRLFYNDANACGYGRVMSRLMPQVMWRFIAAFAELKSEGMVRDGSK